MMYYHPVPVTITTHRRGFTNRPESLDGEMLHFEDQGRGCRFRSAMSSPTIDAVTEVPCAEFLDPIPEIYSATGPETLFVAAACGANPHREGRRRNGGDVYFRLPHRDKCRDQQLSLPVIAPRT
jgi:hypothetical protein